MDQFKRVQVDTPQVFFQAALELTRFAQSRRGCLGLDCEGVDLGRNGPLTVLVLKPIDLSINVSHFPAYVIDVAVLTPAFVFARLRCLLEDDALQKVMFDCRSDSDALFHQYNVRLAGVLDLQLFDQVTRNKLRARRGPKLYVPSMTVVAEEHLTRQEFVALRGGGAAPHKTDMGVWGRRPLSASAWHYSAADAHCIDLIFRSMLRWPVSTSMLQSIKYHSEARLDQFRAYPTPVVFDARFKDFILVEIPLTRVYNGEEE